MTLKEAELRIVTLEAQVATLIQMYHPVVPCQAPNTGTPMKEWIDTGIPTPVTPWVSTGDPIPLTYPYPTITA